MFCRTLPQLKYPINMADGNFNRSPLASNNYQSGVRAGRMTMRTLAIKAFEAHINTCFPGASEEEKLAMIESFKNALQ